MGFGFWFCIDYIYNIVYNFKMTEVEYESEDEIHYQNGEIVWAKITGFPWWPAVVKDIPDQHKNKFCVNFIADNTHAFVGINKIAKYEELRDDINMSKHMIKGLRKAILEADQKIQKFRQERDQTHAPLAAQLRCQAPTQKQLLKSPLIKQTILQENLPQQIQQQEQYRDPPKRNITNHRNRIKQSLQFQNSDQEESITFNSKLKRQQHVHQLLKQYKLINIPSINVKATIAPITAKLHKKKRIFKAKNKKGFSKKFQGLDEENFENMLCRKIYIFLRQKSQISVKERREISLHLSKQVLDQFFKLQSSMDDINRLFKWLNLSKPETITAYYDNWSSFSLQKDKASNLTTTEQ